MMSGSTAVSRDGDGGSVEGVVGAWRGGGRRSSDGGVGRHRVNARWCATQRQRRCCRRRSGAEMPWTLARWSGAATGDDDAVVVGTPARGRRRTLFASDGGQEF
ncbi:hypothetical protein U1Q18_029525 [Sarracenia purpurea var. burkii]